MDKHQLISKYGKKFALSATSRRPLLEGIHYALGGTVFVTDAHYALRVRKAHKFDKPLTLHAKTGAPIEGEYPDFEKAFPSSFTNEIPISNKSLEHVLMRARCAADVASRINKKVPAIMLTAANGATYLQLHNKDQQLELSAFFGNTQKVEASKRSLNAEFLYTALSVFSDMGSDVVVRIGDPMSPIVLTDEKDIDVLILPYRVSN